MRQRVSVRIFTAIFFLYPLLVFLAVRYFDVAIASLGLSIILLGRLLLQKKQERQSFGRIFDVIMWIVVVNSLLNLYFRNELILKLYPVLMSAGMAGVFIHSLLLKKPVIEKFARLYEKALTPEKLEYIRRLTVIWSVWLCLNAALALYTALFSPFDVWMIYNNMVFYLVCGVIFAVDISYRKLRRVYSR